MGRWKKSIALLLLLLILIGHGTVHEAYCQGEDSVTGLSSFVLLNLFNERMGRWSLKEEMIRLTDSSNPECSLVYLFDPTEPVNTLIHSSAMGEVRSAMEVVEEYSADQFMSRFKSWLDSMYELSAQMTDEYEVTTINVPRYEALMLSEALQFDALKAQYVSGELIAETDYTDASGENNEMRMEWEILPIQFNNATDQEMGTEMYIFYREMEMYPDDYCTQTLWLLADQEAAWALYEIICESIEEYGSGHGVFRFTE